MDRRAQLFAVFDLQRIVAGKASQLVDGGDDACDRRFVFGEKVRVGGQKISPRCTFSISDLQQQGRNLVLHLDRVHDPGVILSRLVDEDHRGGTDGNQHEERRRKQQDLTNRALSPGTDGFPDILRDEI